MHSSNDKRKALTDITNADDIKRWSKYDVSHWLPIEPLNTVPKVPELPPQFNIQNVHPMLPFYNHEKKTDHISHGELIRLMQPQNEHELINVFQGQGVVALFQPCEFCGGSMRMIKDRNSWYWICSRRVNGVKCNKGKFSIFKGTIFDNTHLSVENVCWFLWHFVHRLTEEQCKQYMGIGQRTKMTVVKWYRKCRDVCEEWMNRHPPQLGGFGKIVEMDESFFPGVPKYGKGRRLGWEDVNELGVWPC